MRHGKKLRKLLNGLGKYGVLIRWTVSMCTGVRIWVQDWDGYPRAMNPGTAKARLRELEREVWGV